MLGQDKRLGRSPGQDRDTRAGWGHEESLGGPPGQDGETSERDESPGQDGGADPRGAGTSGWAGRGHGAAPLPPRRRFPLRPWRTTGGHWGGSPAPPATLPCARGAGSRRPPPAPGRARRGRGSPGPPPVPHRPSAGAAAAAAAAAGSWPGRAVPCAAIWTLGAGTPRDAPLLAPNRTHLGVKPRRVCSSAPPRAGEPVPCPACVRPLSGPGPWVGTTWRSSEGCSVRVLLGDPMEVQGGVHWVRSSIGVQQDGPTRGPA